MAVAFIMDFAGGTSADYDWVMERMALGDRLPARAVFHAAGATADGWRVCDVWESADAFQQFADARIGPLTAERGMSPPEIRSFEVHEIRRNAPAPITFLQLVHLPQLDATSFVEMDKQVVGADRQAPAGCIFHVNGMLDGEWVVLDAWTDRDTRDTFVERQVAPAMQAAGIAGPPEIEDLALYNSLTEPAAHPAGV